MAYPSGSPSGFQDYYAPGQPSAYGDYSQWTADPEPGPKVSHRRLTLTVALLGLCTYLASYGPMLNLAGIDWDVRFAVLAGLLAAFGLLPNQAANTKVIAALAAIGFLDGLSRLIILPEGIEPGWALWVVVVLNALQTAVAVWALLTQEPAADVQQAWYAAYAEQYAQAAAQYYGQYAQQSDPDTAPESGTAQAQSVQQVSAPEPRRPTASQDARYAEFVGDGSSAPAGNAPEADAAQPTAGLPNIGHAPTPAAPQSVAVEPEYRTSTQ